MDYSKMTDEELNEAILELKDPTFLHGEIYCQGKAEYGALYAQQWRNADYTHDWRLAGELLEELPTGFRVWKTHKQWICAKINSYWRASNTPQRAICEAWLAWKGAE